MPDKKKTLILEYDPERVTWFYEKFKDYVLIVTNNATVAKQLLHGMYFDLILLDHDLGGQAFVDSNDPNTGWQVTREIPATQNKNTNVIIHSWNTGAAKRMEAFLRDSGEYTGSVVRAPFGTWDKT